jgi:hypothetical protein
MPSDGLHIESARPLALTQLNTSLFLTRLAGLGRSRFEFRKLKIILFERTSFAPDLHGLLLTENVGPISE